MLVGRNGLLGKANGLTLGSPAPSLLLPLLGEERLDRVVHVESVGAQSILKTRVVPHLITPSLLSVRLGTLEEVTTVHVLSLSPTSLLEDRSNPEVLDSAYTSYCYANTGLEPIDLAAPSDAY